MNKPLAAKVPIGPVLARGQRHLVVNPCFVFSRHRYLDHLRAGFAFEHAMAYFRWLDNPIAGLHPERLALVFLNE